VVGRAAGFHDDEIDLAVGEPAFELRARETVRFVDAPISVGHDKLNERKAGSVIRIISARKATKRESAFYGGENI